MDYRTRRSERSTARLERLPNATKSIFERRPLHRLHGWCAHEIMDELAGIGAASITISRFTNIDSVPALARHLLLLLC